MNCPECQQLVQQRLDGERVAERPALDRHLAECGECRDWHAAAQRLQEGLRLRRPPTPSGDLTERIVNRVLAERQNQVRFRRRLVGAAALAASLLLMVGFGLLRQRFQDGQPGPALVDEKEMDHQPATIQPEPRGIQPREKQANPLPVASLNQNVEEAGSALVALVTRTADQTVAEGRKLLPEPMATPTMPTGSGWQGQLKPPARSLQEASEVVTSGLEPVATSARRAVNLFWKELPPMSAVARP